MMNNSLLHDLSVALMSLKRDTDPLMTSPLSWMIMANGEAEPDDYVIIFGF